MLVLSYYSTGPWQSGSPPVTLRLLAILHVLIGTSMLIFDVIVMPKLGLGQWGAIGWFVMTWQGVMTAAPLVGGLSVHWRDRRARSVGLASFATLAVTEVITFGHGMFCWIEGHMTGDKSVVAFGTVATMMSVALLVFSTSALQYLRDLRPSAAPAD
jgi:hypothetical protein